MHRIKEENYEYDQSQVSCSTFFYDFASVFKLIFTLIKIDQIIICLKKKYNSTVEKKIKIKILKF